MFPEKMDREQEIYLLINQIRDTYSEWLEYAEETGDNPEKIVSLIITKRYFDLLDKIRTHKC